MQPVGATYYLLKEVLKKQKSPGVVLDVFCLGITTQYGAKGFVSNALDHMKFNRNKLEAIWNCTSPEGSLLCLLPVLKYHFRKSSLQRKT